MRVIIFSLFLCGCTIFDHKICVIYSGGYGVPFCGSCESGDYYYHAFLRDRIYQCRPINWIHGGSDE